MEKNEEITLQDLYEETARQWNESTDHDERLALSATLVEIRKKQVEEEEEM